MKIVAARDLSETATELKSKLTGQNLMGYRSGCGGCRRRTPTVGIGTTVPVLGPALYRWVNPTIKNGLLPILDKASKQNISVNLHDLMLRFVTDNIFELALGRKLKTLTT
ncbi:hypothetical protein RND71_005853 [Anisodus tanguticus]|uniref:Uncharacterized protein n=1 Tax=Anisodus tanguticus TaxID=243964 RepID=A0AAE1VSR1_9SOLA|nr:hypothetical protein RND71_005853 [Anisodus tanguticus]